MEETNHQTALSGYQDEREPRLCKVVNALTKALIPHREEPVLLAVNYATLVEDPNKTESLIVPFNLMAHGVKVDLVPEKIWWAKMHDS